MPWEPYPQGSGTTVDGDVRVLRSVLDRDLVAYLPPSHGEARRRFPVLYMHDAQNLFDVQASESGEWRGTGTSRFETPTSRVSSG